MITSFIMRDIGAICQFPTPTAADRQSPLHWMVRAARHTEFPQFPPSDLQRTAVDFGKRRVSAADYGDDCIGLWQSES